MTINIKRAELLKITSLVRAAIASADYIPALTHIKFDGEFATAYNDISAIVVRADVGIKRCVPGELLMKALGSFAGETVALTFDEKLSTLLVQSGRSKIKLPTLQLNEFPFEVPSDVAPELALTAELIKGIEKCLLSVGNDQRHPAQMGVTLEIDAGHAVLYSTDNVTISRFVTGTKIELPGDSPVILPTFFCEQLVSLCKAFPETKQILVLLPGALLVDFVGKDNNTTASLFTKTVVDLEPMDFAKIVKRFVPANVKAEMRKIPDAFDDAFSRALLVLGNEVVKTTSVKVSKGHADLFSESAMGEADDSVPYSGPDTELFKIDPTLVVRGLKQCAMMDMRPKVLILADDSGAFTHLISHVS